MAILTSTIVTPLSVALYNADGSFRTPVYLVTIDLAAYGANPAKSLHLCMSGADPYYIGPDGQLWDGIVAEVGQINAGGAWLTARWNPADMDLVLLDRRVTDQAVAETFHDLFPDYEFTGARVLVQIAFNNTTSTGDYRTIFDGRLEEWRQMDAGKVLLYCQQDRRWSVPIPPNKFTKTDYPYLPDGVNGTPRPILIGDWNDGERIPGISALYEAAQAGVARGAFPAVISDLQSSTGGLVFPKALLSDKAMATEPARLMFYEPTVDAMAYSVLAPTVTGAGPVYGQLLAHHFYVPVLPIEIKNATNTASGSQELVRKDKSVELTGKCSLDYDAGQRVCELVLPDVSEIGTFVTASVYIWYNKNNSVAPYPQFGVKNAVTIDGLADLSHFPSTPATDDEPHLSLALNVGPTATGGTNSIPSWSEIKNSTLFCEVRAAGQKVEIHRLLLTVYYKPQPRVLTPGVTRDVPTLHLGAAVTREQKALVGKIFRRPVSGQDVVAYDNAIYAFGTGVPDSGHASSAADGTYTGTSGTLIEHPCDVARWALQELGGVSSGEITTAASTFGSFVDARAALPSYRIACQISKEQEVEEFLEDLGAQVLCWFHRRTTEAGAPFVAIPWAVSGSQNYRDAGDLVNFMAAGSFVVRDTLRVDRTAQASVANGVRVNYDYDPRTRAYGDQLYITPTASRVYSGGAFTTDGTRVTAAATSAAIFGTREITVNLPWVKDRATASSILTRMFDWRVNPRIVLKFNTFLNALDLERGHILRMGSDWDSFLTYPKAGGNGSWDGKNLQVYSVTKLRELPVQYAVTAIET